MQWLFGACNKQNLDAVTSHRWRHAAPVLLHPSQRARQGHDLLTYSHHPSSPRQGLKYSGCSYWTIHDQQTDRSVIRRRRWSWPTAVINNNCVYRPRDNLERHILVDKLTMRLVKMNRTETTATTLLLLLRVDNTQTTTTSTIISYKF